MKKNLHIIFLLAIGLVYPVNAFCEDEIPPIVIIDPMPYETAGIPFIDNALTSDWSGEGAKEPKGWNAITVLELDNISDDALWPLKSEYPSNWEYSETLNATVIKDKRIAAQVLMLPYVQVPWGYDDLTLSVETMVSGTVANIVYCVTEGTDIRFDGNSFLMGMLDAIADENSNEPAGVDVFKEVKFDITGKAGKGLNIVLVFVNLNGELTDDVTYAVRNVKITGISNDVSTSQQSGISAYVANGSIVVKDAPEGAVMSLVNLQSGIQIAAKSVSSALETVAVPYPGIYAVVINGESFKVLVP